MLTAHFRTFAIAEAESEDPLWEWAEDASAGVQLYAEGSCYMAKIRLTARGTAIAADTDATAAPPEDGPVSCTVAEERADTSAPDAQPWQEEEETQTVDPIVLERGTVLLMVAGQAPRGRIGSAVALELRLCARHHGIGPDRLRAISAGLCALLRSTGDRGHNCASTDEAFLEDVGRLAGVRRAPMRLLIASSDADISAAAEAGASAAAALQVNAKGVKCAGLMQGIDATCDGGEHCPWSLDIEALYPENVPARLPYMHADTGGTPGSVFGFAIALSARLGDQMGRWGPGGHSQTDPRRRRLVAIECTAEGGSACTYRTEEVLFSCHSSDNSMLGTIQQEPTRSPPFRRRRRTQVSKEHAGGCC